MMNGERLPAGLGKQSGWIILTLLPFLRIVADDGQRNGDKGGRDGIQPFGLLPHEMREGRRIAPA